MSDQTTQNDDVQHFSIVAPGTVTFARVTGGLILTVTGAVTVAFDGKGGTPVMELAVGTHQFTHIHVKTLVFGGAGTVSGSGYCI